MNPIRLTETILKFDTIDEVGPLLCLWKKMYFDLLRASNILYKKSTRKAQLIYR